MDQQGEPQLLISGVGGDQPLVMSAEDAAQFLAQAGLQLADVADNGEQVIINNAGTEEQQQQQQLLKTETVEEPATVTGDLPVLENTNGEGGTDGIVAGEEAAAGAANGGGEAVALNDINDGTILYIDPNDPQAAALLQQAGLTLSEDGTVQSIGGGIVEEAANAAGVGNDMLKNDIVSQALDQAIEQQAVETKTELPPQVTLPTEPLPPQSTTGEVGNAIGSIINTSNGSAGVPQELFLGSAANDLEKAGINISSTVDNGTTTLPDVAQMITQPEPPKIVTKTVSAVTPKPRMALGQTLTPKSKVVVNSPSSQDRYTPMATPTSPQKKTVNQTQSTSQITVGNDQQQVFYSVSGEDGKTQQYMMLCPKDMDQNTLITTLVRQISADPSNKGKKTIRITQHKNTPTTPASEPAPRARITARGRTSTTPKTSRQSLPTQSVRPNQSKEINNRIGEILSATENNILPPTIGNRDVANIVDSADNFESVLANDPGAALSLPEAATEGARVYVRCNYCDTFRSTLNSDTWEAILNHILPVAKEELQTTFYGDLEKHFLRSVRIQVNGKQMVRTRSISGSTEVTQPQCEVVLTHSLICKKTRREFIVQGEPDAAFVANLAKHIRQMQPGSQSARANSLLCIFCNQPFTYEDYLRHIQPHLDTIIATLCCFSGAYCATTYEANVKATKPCQACHEAEPADLRFLPCLKFSTEYQCLSKLQFGIECFRENYGDNGFMRLNTNNLAKCSVCKNPQQVYCAVFQVTSTILDEAEETTRDVESQVCVCVNCQKQFINIVMKEQGFDDKLKQFQLKNMEQLCSCLRVILGQAKTICEERQTLIYTVQESAVQNNSAVHTVKLAELTELQPITKLIALAESDVVGSPTKAFFMCDLCMFTIDLTSLLISPINSQKNEMLLAIVLEHLVPHTESLLSVIANTASNKTFNFKLEVMARVQETGPASNQRKIVLSLTKKFVSPSSGLEIALEKDEERTLSQLRASVRNNRNFVNVRASSDSMPAKGSAASQLVDVNRFIDKQKGKLGTLAQCGCNTHLLSAYTECRLCGKFCFPDFRLSGNSTRIDLCENCVETVLTLCLPSDPEVLEIGEECLALRHDKVIGHRLVLANNVKKWLSLDGVNQIKKTVEEFNNASGVFSRLSDCGTIFSEALKQHLLANLKTCQTDDDITTAVTGFTVTDDFFRNSKYTGRDAETAAALASLQEQSGLSLQEADSGNRNIIVRRKQPEKQIEVRILARRTTSHRKTPIPIRIGPPLRGGAAGSAGRGRYSNGMVIDVGSAANKKSIIVTPSQVRSTSATSTPTSSKVVKQNDSATPTNNAASKAPAEEESVSAIQNFIEETKTPSPSVKITSSATGVVNIKAIASPSIEATSPQKSRGRGGRPPKSVEGSPVAAASPGSVRNMKGVSMVTLTAGGIIRKVPQVTPSTKRKRNDPDFDSDDEGDSDDLDEEDEDETEANGAVNGDKKSYRPPKKILATDHDSSLNDSTPSGGDRTRRGRVRREKKMFDL